MNKSIEVFCDHAFRVLDAQLLEGTSLPELRPRAIADRATGEREEIELVADTLLLTQTGVCVAWGAALPLGHATPP